MSKIPEFLTEQHRAVLDTNLSVIGVIDRLINQLEYLKTAQLSSVVGLASDIAEAEEHGNHGALVHRAVQAEVAAVTRTGHLSVSSRMSHAIELIRDYPGTSEALQEGTISLRHAETIVRAGEILLSAAAREKFEAEVLPLALQMTAHQLRAHAKHFAELFAERSIDERYEHARAGREVKITDLDDGMAQLTATIGAVEAYAIKDRLTEITRTIRDDERASDGPAAGADSRTNRQVQADVFVDLLLTGRPTARSVPGSDASETCAADDSLALIRGRVQVSVPVFSLIGSDVDEVHPYTGPSMLAGYGPIPLQMARKVVGNASSWERVLTHPIRGTVLAVDRYRPHEDLKRYLSARDQCCRYIGCTKRLDHCDIDHTVPYSRGGATDAANTGHLCRAHHRMKHFEFLGRSGWKATQESGGVYEWRSPTGRRYTDTPVSTVMFKPVKRPPRAHLTDPP